MAVLDDRGRHGRLTPRPTVAIGAATITTVVAVVPWRAVEASGRRALGLRPLAVVSELVAGIQPTPLDVPIAIAERFRAPTSAPEIGINAAPVQPALTEHAFDDVSISVQRERPVRCSPRADDVRRRIRG